MPTVLPTVPKEPGINPAALVAPEELADGGFEISVDIRASSDAPATRKRTRRSASTTNWSAD